MLLRKVISVGMMCVIGMGLSGCPKVPRIVVKIITIHFYAPDKNPQVASLQKQATQNAVENGYDNAQTVVDQIDMPQVLASLDSGQSSSGAFASYAIDNAYLANTTGTAVAEMMSNDSSLASSSFSYHVSGPYLVFDSPANVDQWIRANRGLNAQTIKVSVPDMMVGTAGSGSQVTVSMTAMSNSTSLATSTTTYYPSPAPGGGDCFTRCLPTPIDQ